MIIKELRDEDFTNFKLPSMVIGFPSCTFKCEKECPNCKGMCQNSALVKAPDIEINPKAIVDRYLSNPITKALVCGGLEPFDSWEELQAFIRDFRYYTPDDIVIYTGYYEDEIQPYINKLKADFKNIVVKFGRYIPDQQPHYDEVLGVNLASDNQKGVRIC